MNKINWLGEETKDCSDMLGYILWHGQFGHYDKIDIMLYTINCNASVLMMVGFLRYTVMMHSHTKRLPSWPLARDKVYRELINRGEDADSEMIGLIEL